MGVRNEEQSHYISQCLVLPDHHLQDSTTYAA